MNDLISWLRQQLDTDEQLALAASPGPWRPNAEHDEVLAVDDVRVADGFALSGRQLRATVDHITTHDPARVLRQVQAHRAILDAYEAEDNGARYGGCGDDCEWKALGYAVKLLASIYSDRDGYREEWSA